MKRWLFFGVVAFLLELFTLMTAKGLYWLVKPYLPNSQTIILITTLLIGNAMLATLFFGLFRFGMGYLAVLWLVILTMILTFIIGYGAQLLGFVSFSDGWELRVVSVLSFMGLVLLAIYNAYTPVVRHLTVQIDKPITHPIKVAVVSDLHLGALFGADQLYELAAIMEREGVDALLMAGDIMDDDTHIYDE